MSFLAPAALAFAITIPVVIVLYLLKRKRVVQIVSSTLLWQRFVAETQAHAPFQRLRRNWLLMLQLTLLALAVAALARPYLAGQHRPTALRVLVLDASASMQSTDETPSRFERARAEALRWVDALRDGEQMMVLEAAGATVVKQSPTSDRAALRRALHECRVTDGPTRLADALKLAGSFTFERQGEEERSVGEIHLFSDGAAADLSELENLNLPVVFHPVGRRMRNAAIVAMELRPHPEDTSRSALFTTVANHTEEPLRTELQLLFDGQRIEGRGLNLAPAQTVSQVFIVTQRQDGLLTLRLEVEDDLAADNQASVLHLRPRPVKVLLVSRGNRFLERALASVSRVQLTRVPDLLEPAPDADIVVLDTVTPATLPVRNTLAIQVTPAAWFSATGVIATPSIVDWKATHPLLRYVNFDNVQVSEAQGIRTPGWATPVAETPQGPVTVAGELGAQRIAWVGFDLLQSTWPLRVSFPVFIANAVEWLNPDAGQAARLWVRAGDPFRLPPDSGGGGGGGGGVTIRLPDGREARLERPGGVELAFGATDRQGVYRVRAGTNEFAFCVHAIDAQESRTEPRQELPLGKYAAIQASAARRTGGELWRWFAAAAFCLLLFEWWYYHRRTV